MMVLPIPVTMGEATTTNRHPDPIMKAAWQWFARMFTMNAATVTVAMTGMAVALPVEIAMATIAAETVVTVVLMPRLPAYARLRLPGLPRLTTAATVVPPIRRALNGKDVSVVSSRMSKRVEATPPSHPWRLDF